MRNAILLLLFLCSSTLLVVCGVFLARTGPDWANIFGFGMGLVSEFLILKETFAKRSLRDEL